MNVKHTMINIGTAPNNIIILKRKRVSTFFYSTQGAQSKLKPC